jgi:hypothetical protein
VFALSLVSMFELEKVFVTVSLDKQSSLFQDRRQCKLMRTMASFRMCMPRSLMEMDTRVQDSAQVGTK